MKAKVSQIAYWDWRTDPDKRTENERKSSEVTGYKIDPTEAATYFAKLGVVPYSYKKPIKPVKGRKRK